MAQVGEKAPHFALQNTEGSVVNLSDHIGMTLANPSFIYVVHNLQPQFKSR